MSLNSLINSHPSTFHRKRARGEDKKHKSEIIPVVKYTEQILLKMTGGGNPCSCGQTASGIVPIVFPSCKLGYRLLVIKLNFELKRWFSG